jgi:hypothetical protein
MLISGHVNHTTVKNIPEGEEVLEVTFLLFKHPIIILFDSGASHGFITSASAKRAKLSLTVAKPSYMIRTRGRPNCGKSDGKRSPTRVGWARVSHSPRCLGWTRDICHFGNELDETTQSYFGYS